MKNNILRSLKAKKFRSICLTALVIAGPLTGFSQQSYTFTNCSATGSTGPTQAQANTAYASTNLSGSVTVTGGIQSFTIPITGAYRLEAYGAAGGTQLYSPGYPGGKGAFVRGDFTLTAGTVLKILVGQMGGNTQGVPVDNAAPGGGGGSFVYTLATSPAPLIAAGGGGGGSRSPMAPDASTTTTGNAALIGGAGGVAGNGGQSNAGSLSYWAGGGAGWLTDGTGGNNSTNYLYTAGTQGALGGRTPANGGAGGTRWNDGVDEGGDGGFGGGGGGGSDNMGTGGGGGYSGGGGARSGTAPTDNAGGGGGGSYNGGVNQVNTQSVNAGHGMVVIRELCNISLLASTPNPTLPSICSGSSVTLTTNAVSNYTWSNGNSTSTAIVVSPATTTSYSVTGTSAANCQANAFITVTVNSSSPVISVATTPTQVCVGQAVTFTASGALSYTWSNGISNSVPFFPGASQVYTVSGQNGCGITTSTAAIAITPFTVNVFSPSSTLCAGSVISLTATSAGNSYTWQPTGSTGSVAAFSPVNNTSYTVTATNGTCIGTASISVNTVPIPTVSASASASNICSAVVVTLTATGGNSYTWNPGNLTGPVISVTPSTSVLYSVTASNVQGCQSGTSQVVVVNTPPVLIVSSSAVYICNGDQVTISASGASTYTWSNAANGNSINVTPSQTTVYTVTGTSASTSCTATGASTIDVFNPVISITGNSVICDGGTATLTAAGAQSYTWSNSSLLNPTTVSPSVSTVYSVNAMASSGNVTCPGSGSINVTVNPNPTINAVSDRSVICRGETVTFSASGASTYTWNGTSSGPTVVVTPTTITTLLYNVSGTGNNGCSGSGTISVKVNACNGISVNDPGNNGILIFPNPSNGELNVSAGFEIDLNVFNETGQLVRTLTLNQANSRKTTIVGLEKGVYFITGQSDSQKISSKIIVTN